MNTLKNINEFELGWVNHFAWMLDDLVNERLEAWVETDEDNDFARNAYFSKSSSNQSPSTYWTVGADDMDELCVRVSDHACVNCASQVHHNVNLMDFVTVERDEEGEEEWFVDVDVATAAIKVAADLLSGKTQ